MPLIDLNLKGLYDSDSDNLLSDFYIPALTESSRYKRIAGYFSSNALAISARGLYQFIENEGKMYLIANVVLSQDDQGAIRQALQEKENAFLKEMETMEDALKKGHLRLLAWMIKNNHLEIRIAAVPRGLEHKKKGILYDEHGQIISFSGSDNETVSGWLHNHEDFHVFCSWIDGDLERHLNPDIKSFDRLWNDETINVRTYDVSEAFKRDLIRTAPRDDDEFRTLTNEITEELLRRYEEKDSNNPSGPRRPTRDNLHDFLRGYQIEAIKNWEDNGRRGILKMATGTGKTFTAIAAMNRYLEENEGGLVVIVAPKQLLVSQWSSELIKMGFRNVIEVMRSSSTWSKKFKGALLKVELGHERETIAVATYASFSSDLFMNLLQKYEGRILLIGDEMHNSWAPKYRYGLLSKYEYRLGLSATPERYMDEKGTLEMQEYFGGIVFTLEIKDAIPEFLVPYEYYAEIVELTPEEMVRYQKMSITIAQRIAANDGDIDEGILHLLLRRARLVTNSESKWCAFETILDSIQNMRRTLIYCSDKQIDSVLERLHSRKIRTHKITFKEPLAHRQEIIEKFNNDNYQAIVAIKVLDEGIDVPGIERAIIMASSGNPIEYIQRRGRILRRSNNKEHATIHDVLVFPWGTIPDDISTSERAMLKKEMKRVREFVHSAMNPCNVMNKVVHYLSLIE